MFTHFYAYPNITLVHAAVQDRGSRSCLWMGRAGWWGGYRTYIYLSRHVAGLLYIYLVWFLLLYGTTVLASNLWQLKSWNLSFCDGTHAALNYDKKRKNIHIDTCIKSRIMNLDNRPNSPAKLSDIHLGLLNWWLIATKR